ncbi:MAG TPA: hypothetical protein VN999_06385 [Thermoanaerobaculia bacterium]|nr:hypothetical protein [Thermoanaerobaculia bacterium]
MVPPWASPRYQRLAPRGDRRRHQRLTWWLSRERPYVIQAVVEVPMTGDGSSTAISATIRYTMTGQLEPGG